MELQEALQAIGLNEKESAVYLALLQLGRGSAYSIASKSGLKNPTTYVILDELIKKGLVQRVPRVRKQLYIALPPEQAFASAEEKLHEAKQKLPELSALTKGEGSKVSAVYFEGVEGIKQLMEYRLKEMKGKSSVAFWATDKGVDPELTHYFKEEWGPLMHKYGISMRGIVPNDPTLKTYRDSDEIYDRHIKVVPMEEYSSEVAIDVLGDIVRIQDYKNLQGIALESAEVAKTFREIFEMVWSK